MIWPFKRKEPGIREVKGDDAMKLIQAAQTMVLTAIRFNATRMRQDLDGFGGQGIPRQDWVVEARRKDAKDFLIWSIEHDAWWRSNHEGYTNDVKEAGRYTFDEAIDICNNPHTRKVGVPNEAIVLASTYQE